MTKGDYGLIAETIRGLALTHTQRAHVTSRFAAALAWNDQAFERMAFVQACDPYNDTLAAVEHRAEQANPERAMARLSRGHR